MEVNQSKESAENYAYSALKDALYNRQLAPGSKLTERNICEALGVGRTPARAALKRLHDEGFIHLIPKRGGFVVSASKELMHQQYEVRTALLMLAVQKKIADFDEHDFQKMEVIVRNELESFKRMDFKQYLDDINDFFDVIIQKAENPMLEHLYSIVNNRTHILLILYDDFYMSDRDQLRSYQEHKKIIEALKKQSVAEVQTILDEYYYSLVENIRFDKIAVASIDKIYKER